MAGRGQRSHDLEARGVGGQRVGDCAVLLRRDQDGGRSAGRAHVRDAGGDRVVVVEDVTGRGGVGDTRRQVVTERAHGVSSALPGAAGGAGQPVEQGGRVGVVVGQLADS